MRPITLACVVIEHLGSTSKEVKPKILRCHIAIQSAVEGIVFFFLLLCTGLVRRRDVPRIPPFPVSVPKFPTRDACSTRKHSGGIALSTVDMIQGTRRWLRRNRTNFAIGAGVLGAGYLAGQYVLGKIGEARQRMSDDRIAKEKCASILCLEKSC